MVIERRDLMYKIKWYFNASSCLPPRSVWYESFSLFFVSFLICIKPTFGIFFGIFLIAAVVVVSELAIN